MTFNCIYCAFAVYFTSSSTSVIQTMNPIIKGLSVHLTVLHESPVFWQHMLSQCETLPADFEMSNTSIRLCPHLRHILTFWLCLLLHVSDFAAHPDCPEAALGAGRGAGGVSFGSPTVHGVHLRPDRMSTVSLHCFCFWNYLLLRGIIIKEVSKSKIIG